MIFFAFVSALIFVSHGVGEHCSRYEEFGSVLARQGFLVVSHDHGKFFIYIALLVYMFLGGGKGRFALVIFLLGMSHWPLRTPTPL